MGNTFIDKDMTETRLRYIQEKTAIRQKQLREEIAKMCNVNYFETLTEANDDFFSMESEKQRIMLGYVQLGNKNPSEELQRKIKLSYLNELVAESYNSITSYMDDINFIDNWVKLNEHNKKDADARKEYSRKLLEMMKCIQVISDYVSEAISMGACRDDDCKHEIEMLKILMNEVGTYMSKGQELLNTLNSELISH